jgi:predicted nucleotidyltransferase
MEPIELHPDFSEFLRLLNAKGVDYLVVGAYAVNYHGYIRSTDDIDLWVAINPDNARRLVDALKGFGFDLPNVNIGLFLKPDKMVRMGRPPVRIEIATTISGVQYDACRQHAIEAKLGNVPVKILSLADLRANKEAAGRSKDLVDLEHLPKPE